MVRLSDFLFGICVAVFICGVWFTSSNLFFLAFLLGAISAFLEWLAKK